MSDLDLAVAAMKAMNDKIERMQELWSADVAAGLAARNLLRRAQTYMQASSPPERYEKWMTEVGNEIERVLG